MLTINQYKKAYLEKFIERIENLTQKGSVNSALRHETIHGYVDPNKDIRYKKTAKKYHFDHLSDPSQQLVAALFFHSVSDAMEIYLEEQDINKINEALQSDHIDLPSLDASASELELLTTLKADLERQLASVSQQCAREERMRAQARGGLGFFDGHETELAVGGAALAALGGVALAIALGSKS